MNKFARLFCLSAATLAAQSVTINTAPSREFGQPTLPPSTSPFNLPSSKENFVEGREMSSPLSIAFDNSVSPPIVYVADTFNNRVLAWRNAATITKTNFADLVIGQPSLQQTNAGGPGTGFSTGLSIPAAVAVDAKGNLYVADEGNNRILRYPAPFNQSAGFLAVDLVIGQVSISSGTGANGGTPVVSAKGLAFYAGGNAFTLAMTFDAQGNLWVTDPGNNRVLRFPVGSLAAGTPQPSADLVLGQNDFVSSAVVGFSNQTIKTSLAQPGGLAFDQTGRLFVSDAGSRVLQYSPPFNNGSSAARVLGIAQAQPGQTVLYPTQYTLGAGGVFTGGGSPEGLFTIGNNLFVMDSPQSRIMRYDDAANWPAESPTTFSPPALTVIGQPSFSSGKPNQGASQPTGSTFAAPGAGAAVTVNGTTEIWIADTGNNRVIALAQTGNQTFPSPASRLLGQLDYIYNASNLVEGRELFLRGSFSAGGVVIDKNSNPPHLYVADTFNNRILGFKDARLVGTDARTVLTMKADLVIGQPDLFTTAVNYPSPTPAQLNDSGLNGPIGLVLDSAGNLFVADSGNSRILRFPTPFGQPSGGLQHANLVLGQSSFTALKITDPSAFTMNTPWGLTIFDDGSVGASDVAHNRVLIFRKPSGDFANGQAAAIVLGQSGFSTTGSGTGNGSFNAPRNIATDSSDRLYVADAANNRLLVFTRAISASNGASSAYQLPGLSGPQGVTVSTLTGEIWVANSGANQILRYPEFQTLQLNGPTPTASLLAGGPLQIALDAFDDVVALENSNRMTFYFPSLTYQHAANFNQQPMAPGMLAYLYRLGQPFSIADGAAVSYPWPMTLSDLQVTVNGMNAPIFRTSSSGRIDFQVPSMAPCGCNGEANTADFVVSNMSTGQILAAGTFQMQQASPGFFTTGAGGTGQIAALNHDDNSVNSASNQVARTHIIELYLTGMGRVSGQPADGTPPPGPVASPVPTTVIMANPGPGALPAGNIIYSGLSPSFPGGWQVDVTVPNEVSPSNTVTTVVTLYDIQSNLGAVTSGNPNGKIVTTIAVK
jgi:uncharacterized protein (TIGR03437 family)